MSARKKKRDKRRRERRRRSFRFTREGKVFVAVTMGVGLAAVNTGNNLLYLVLGLMLSLLLVSGTLSDLALTRIRLRRKPPRRTFVGATSIVELTLRNNKTRFPSYALEVEDRTDSESSSRRCFFLKTAPGSDERSTYRRVAQRRGMLTFIGFTVRTRYPFGLIEKGRTLEARDEMLVYPRLIDVDANLLRGLGQGQDAPSKRVGHTGDVHSLRDYLDGDGARSIHWKRSAALDRLIVRQRHAAAHARVSIHLDQAEPEHADPEAEAKWHEALEEAISRAASLADLALQRGAAVEVQVRGAASPTVMPGSPPDPIWRFLALLETVPAADAPPLAAVGEHSLVVEVAA